MVARFDTAFAKTERARKHIVDAQASFGLLLEEHHSEIATYCDIDSRDRVWASSLIQQANLRTSVAIGLIIGDVLNNLRSALDYLIWDFGGGRGNDDRLYFPISKSYDAYKLKLKDLRKLVSPEVLSELAAVQAYKGGVGHELWRLNEMNRLEKHRAIVVATVSSIQADFSNWTKSGTLGVIGQYKVVEDGTEFLRRPAAELDPGIMDKEPIFMSTVGFREGELESRPITLPLVQMSNAGWPL